MYLTDYICLREWMEREGPSQSGGARVEERSQIEVGHSMMRGDCLLLFSLALSCLQRETERKRQRERERERLGSQRFSLKTHTHTTCGEGVHLTISTGQNGDWVSERMRELGPDGGSQVRNSIPQSTRGSSHSAERRNGISCE